jgi:hypothetical protein
MEPRFPHIVVRLIGEDGNAFAVLGRVKTALEKGGASKVAVAKFLTEATGGTYDDLIATVMRWVTVE